MPEQYRSNRYPPFLSSPEDKNNGLFVIKWLNVKCIASDGGGWEHVSVSRLDSIDSPIWQHMCIVKDLFWDEEDVVVQFHPKKSEYINNHPGCLHLWRKQGHEFELPPSIMVGYK